MRYPTFILIGAPKAGTTALYHYLDQHPEVFMTEVKEPGFFAFEGETLDYRDADGDNATVCSYTITDLAAYRGLFEEVDRETAAGEATTLYLHSEKAVDRIQAYVPDAKLIVVLRHPVDRAYSSYMHARREGREPIEDFEEALGTEERRIREGWGFLWRYATFSRYAEAIRRYLTAFDEDQIRIYLFEEFVEDPVAIVQDLYEFIGCDSDFEPDTGVRHNASGIPRVRWLDWFLGRRHAIKELVKPLVPEAVRRQVAVRIRNWNLEKPALDDETRRRLTRRFRGDILELQELLGRDLRHWLS